jgi:uncharacterized membrane protein
VPTNSAEKVREFYRKQGEERERKRLIEMFKEQKVLRNCGATGLLVFVNCNTLEVLYLKDDLLNNQVEPGVCGEQNHE